MANDEFLSLVKSMKNVYDSYEPRIVKAGVDKILNRYEKPLSFHVHDEIHEYFLPIYAKIQREMDEIGTYYDDLYRKSCRKFSARVELEKASFMERIMYKSAMRISDEELIYRFETHKWISERDRIRINERQLIPGIYVGLG